MAPRVAANSSCARRWDALAVQRSWWERLFFLLLQLPLSSPDSSWWSTVAFWRAGSTSEFSLGATLLGGQVNPPDGKSSLITENAKKYTGVVRKFPKIHSLDHE